MRYSAKALSRARTVGVTLFIVVGVLIFSVLWAKSGGTIPGITGHGYKFSAEFPNIDNLAHASDVDMAGVPVGTVSGLDIGKGDVDVHMVLHRNGPLHQGATVQIQDKTLIDEAFVEVTDGKGPVLKSGTTLPIASTQNFTSLNTVFDAIRPNDQQAARELLTEFNTATSNRGPDLSNLLSDLANVGAQGQTVFDVLANQTGDLQQLVRQTGTLMAVLDEGQGQIGDLATSAEAVSRATADSSTSLAQSIQELPNVINAAKSSSGSIETLSAALAPIASNLQAAAPTLNQALVVLPPTTRSLREVLSPLNETLVRAPATLGPLPTTATNVTSLFTPTANVLSNLNPMVAFMAPYRQDIAAFFSNFTAVAGQHSTTAGLYGDVEALTELNGNGDASASTCSGLLPIGAVENLQGEAACGSNAAPPAGAGPTEPNAPPGKYPNVQREKY